MSKENDIELLLNSEFTIEEVKSKIDSNIITFGFVFIYLSQKLINILEIFKNDNNKIINGQIFRRDNPVLIRNQKKIKY